MDWFASIDENPLYKFFQFDTTEFYRSIKEPLLEKALKFAEENIDIPTDDKAIIKLTWKSFLFNKNETWVIKDSGLFDVAMSDFDGAEVWKIVGNILLHKLSEKYERKNLALYRDNGFVIFKNVNHANVNVNVSHAMQWGTNESRV